MGVTGVQIGNIPLPPNSAELRPVSHGRLRGIIGRSSTNDSWLESSRAAVGKPAGLHDALLVQGLDRCDVVAEFLEDFVGVLALIGRRLEALGLRVGALMDR